MSCKSCDFYNDFYCYYFRTHTDPNDSCQHYSNKGDFVMACKNCTYFDENDTNGYKGYCSYYRSYEDPDGSCSHFNSSSSTGCFLTSACVAYKGLSDDCIELETMRSFRDNVLKQSKQGRELVKEYYRIAPDIVRGIEHSPNKNRIYDNIYQVILTCMEHIQQNRYESATECYQKMVEGLKPFQVHSLKAEG